MDCEDCYTHVSPQIMYFPRCIPTKEIEATIKPSRICCDCKDLCNEESNCLCAKQSGTSYTFTVLQDLESYVLKYRNVNRPTYECNHQCQCKGNLCGNKLVQGGPRKGLTVKQCNDALKGLGLFTDNVIKRGNFICEYAGEIITEQEASLRFKVNAKHKRMNYIFCIDEYFGDRNVKTFIDPSVYGNIGRYLNHSCNPNCVMVITRINENIPMLALFACKDIDVGQELCYDYGIGGLDGRINSAEGLDRTKCLCGSEECNGFLPYDTRIV